MDKMRRRGVRRVLDVSDQPLDEALTSGGWVGNEGFPGLVLDLRWIVLLRKMQDGQLRGRILASAWHLSSHCSWNGRNGSELALRLRAAQRAWGSMVSFWTSTRSWSLRRTAFLGAVVGAMTSGAETYDWSCAELRKMDAMICRFMRVFLMVKAYDAEARKGWKKRSQILASRSDEGGDRGETHLVASGDVEDAPTTCAGHDCSLGHDAEGIAAGQRRPLEARRASIHYDDSR